MLYFTTSIAKLVMLVDGQLRQAGDKYLRKTCFCISCWLSQTTSPWNDRTIAVCTALLI